MSKTNHERPHRPDLGVAVALVLLVGGGSLQPSAQAQGTLAGESLPPCGAVEAYGVGLAAAESEQWQIAVQRLQAAADSGCVSERGGAAAYWYGRALAETGDEDAAVAAWRRGIEGGLGVLDARLPDALLDHLLRQTQGLQTSEIEQLYDTIAVASEAYADEPVPPWLEAPLTRYLAQTAAVIPDSVKAVGFYDGDWRKGVRPGGADAVLSWWWWQDPLPATPPNERLREHLYRVRLATDRYPSAQQDEGFDDRGRLFVKYGPPKRRERIAFDDTRFLSEIQRLGSRVPASDFPDNEIWIYDHIDPSMVYILTDQAGEYELGDVESLIPFRFQTAITSNDRDRVKAYAALTTLRYIYDELATVSIEYGGLLTSIDDYLDRQLSARLVGRARSREEGRARDSGDPGRSSAGVDSPFDIDAGIVGFGGSAPTPPGQFIQRVRNDARERDRQLARAREQRAPDEQSDLSQNLVDLPWEGGRARFRNADGTTRLDVWWRPDAEALAVTSETHAGSNLESVSGYDQHALVSSVFVEDASERRFEVVNVDFLERGLRSAIEPQVVSANCESAECRVAVQIEQRAARLGPDRDVELGPQVRSGVIRLNSVRALRRTGFEMSDLQPYLPTGGHPFADRAVTPGNPLSIYFEAYDLSPDRNGEIDFTVTYTITLESAGGLLRRGSERTISNVQRIDVQGVNTGQFIILDTSNWGGADKAHIEVRVRDNRTRDVLSRTVTLALESDSS